MKFTYHGKELTGFNSMYNLTHLNERCVELAIAFDFLTGRSFDNGLEVGNVLGHYGVGGHVVVDKYEPASELQRLKRWRVQTVDVLDIGNRVGSRFDWIVSISTLEHVGFDKDLPHDVNASMRAVSYLQSLLQEGGRMLVTVPLGFHPGIDEAVTEDLTGAASSACYVRVNDEDWVESDVPVIVPYASLSHWADSLWVGEFDPAPR